MSLAQAHAHDSPDTPFVISQMVFNALSPLEQLAAKALEKVGKVQIVEQ